jgi:hypothetical protein
VGRWSSAWSPPKAMGERLRSAVCARRVALSGPELPTGWRAVAAAQGVSAPDRRTVRAHGHRELGCPTNSGAKRRPSAWSRTRAVEASTGPAAAEVVRPGLQVVECVESAQGDRRKSTVRRMRTQGGVERPPTLRGWRALRPLRE